jgi:serine/threonine protein kinase
LWTYYNVVEIPYAGQALQRSEVARIAKHLAQALLELHDEGLLHLDLKPPYILLSDRDTPLPTDFGLARILTNGDAILTFTGAGTVQYMYEKHLVLKAKQSTLIGIFITIDRL